MADNSERLGPQIAGELREWLPASGDRLFVETDDAAILDPLGFSVPGELRSPIGRWGLYADGFLHAGDRLVESGTIRPWEDALLYPLLTLYHQHLELLLKIVIRHAPKFDDKIREFLYKNHGLDKLWTKLDEVYPTAHKWASKECTEACSRLIKEFAQHDPESFGARYPVDKLDKQTLEQLRAIDINVLKLGVHKISHYLDTIMESDS